MNQNKSETPEEYRDRQIRTLKSENTTLQLNIRTLEQRLSSVKNFQREVIQLRDNDEASLKAKINRLESDRKYSRVFGSFFAAALIVAVFFFKLKSLNEESRSQSFQKALEDRTWEYHPESDQLKQADRFLSGEVLMLPGDTAIFALPKSQFKLLVIKK